MKRKLYAAAAHALGKRVGRLPSVVVESAEADDFGRAELKLTIGGTRRWTRPIEMANRRGYAQLRDAISALRRGDHYRASKWLDDEAPPRDWVRWGGVEQLRFSRNRYGYERW